MNPDQLLRHFDHIAEAPDAVPRLRRFILDLAVRGKLVEQDPSEQPAGELLRCIQTERVRLLNAGETRKSKANEQQMVTAPYDLPRSWAWSALGPIFLYDAGSKRELNTLDQSRWLLEPEDVEKATGRLVTRVRASERASQSTKSAIKVWDILYGKMRPYPNKVLVADEPGYRQPSPPRSRAPRGAGPSDGENRLTGGASPAFARYIGIDYSGAATPLSSLKGLRVYLADRATPPAEILPPPSPRKYWTRRSIAEWLAERLREEVPTLVGIDHGFSFPLAYFEANHLSHDWPAFLQDFQHHWPTDGDHAYVEAVREGDLGRGAERAGNPRWRRLTEAGAGAKSVFHFDVPGSVAKSTHAGLPWLLYLRRQLGDRLHCWPFDGWRVPVGRSAIAEVYPALWKHAFPLEGRTPDQQDAYAVAAWLRQADLNGSLRGFTHPALTPRELTLARVEGWILGFDPRVASSKLPLSPA